MLVRYCARCGKFVKQGERCSCYTPPERRDKVEHDNMYNSYLWKKTATAARHRANYTDEYLLQYEQRFIEGHTVHHIWTVKERPDLALSLDNLVVVSRRSHDLIHEAYAKGGEVAEEMRRKLLAIRGQI